MSASYKLLVHSGRRGVGLSKAKAVRLAKALVSAEISFEVHLDMREVEAWEYEMAVRYSRGFIARDADYQSRLEAWAEAMIANREMAEDAFRR
jgi:hypothetical protein